VQDFHLFEKYRLMSTKERQQQIYDAIVCDLVKMRNVETFVANVKRPLDTNKEKQSEDDKNLAHMIVKCASAAAKVCRAKTLAAGGGISKYSSADITMKQLIRGTRFSNMYSLEPYRGYLQHVPRTVNVVSRVVAEPVPDSGTTLPLNLDRIVARCTGAYFWPLRFCPVQIAFHGHPRTRVLIFHTGKIVGTGSRGPTSARLAIMMAIEKLAREADIHLRVRDFEIKNLVGTVELGATINCEGIAREFSIETHYDRSSFVGCVWRPFKFTKNKKLCLELYTAGRMNLPGAFNHSSLLEQFSIVHPTLLRFSSSSGGELSVLNVRAHMDETNEEEVTINHLGIQELDDIQTVEQHEDQRLRKQVIAEDENCDDDFMWEGWTDNL
jgi:TATA-box binding protein (TBP) (component of TFIID and TFIIIB)